MFLKISKGCVTASVLFCCSAGVYAQVTGANDDVKRSVTVEEVLHDERYTVAENAALAAGKFFADQDYDSAISEYMQAWKTYEAIGKSAFLDSKILNCRKQIAECYRLKAADLAVEAEQYSKSENYDEAIKLANEAAEMCPELKEKMAAAVARYQVEKKAVENRNQVTVAKLVPDQAEVDTKIETLLAQARNLFRADKIVEAKAKYNEVIVLDHTNHTALRGVRACNIKLDKAGDVRSTTNALRREYEAALGYAVPIRQLGEGESKSLTIDRNPIAKNKNSDDAGRAADLQARLNNIIISEISLTGEQLPEALNIVMEEARNSDPSNQGVNIVLIWPEGYFVDEFGVPMQDANAMNVLQQQGGNNANRNRANNRAANNNRMAQVPMGGPMLADPALGGAMGGAGGMMPAAGYTRPTMAGGYGMDTAQEDMEARKYPKIVLNMSNVSVAEVINRICRQANLKYKVDNSAVVVAPKSVAIGDMEIKLFPLKREALLATDFSNPTQLMLFFGSHGILFPYGSSIVYDFRNSRLIVNNTAENLDKIEELIQTQLNVKDVQVQIQAKFVEVTQNDVKELGFEYVLSSTPDSTNGTLEFDPNDSQLTRHLGNVPDRAFSFTGSSDNFNYDMSVYALDWTDSRDVLFAPRITTLNGETAVIRMVRQIYFADDWDESKQTTTQAEYSNAVMYSYVGPVPTFDTDPTDIGIQLVVKPEVDLANRTITMRMTPVVRQFVGWTTYTYEQSGTVFEDEHGNKTVEVLYEPIFADRIIDTLVTARDGGTVVLGGIIRDESTQIDDQIPILGDLPIVGRLFQSKSDSSKKVHMLIFMTCKLVNPDGSPYFPDSPAYESDGKPIITEAQ